MIAVMKYQFNTDAATTHPVTAWLPDSEKDLLEAQAILLQTNSHHSDEVFYVTCK